MHADYDCDDRLNIQRLLRGTVTIDTDEGRYQGRGISITFGGIRFRSEKLPSVGSSAALVIEEPNFGEKPSVNVRIAEVREGRVYAEFISTSPALVRLLARLLR